MDISHDFPIFSLHSLKHEVSGRGFNESSLESALVPWRDLHESAHGSMISQNPIHRFHDFPKRRAICPVGWVKTHAAPNATRILACGTWALAHPTP